MAETDVLNEIVGETPDVVRDQAVRRLRKKRDFHAHLFIYTVVNAATWVVWALTGSGYPWPIWLTLGWGIGVLANAWDVYIRHPITEADIRREVDRMTHA